MDTSPTHGIARTIWQPIAPTVLALCLMGVLTQGCAKHSNPKAFTTAEEAAQALADAVRTDDVQQLVAIAGTDAKPIFSSGDDVADRLDRRRFLTLYDEKHSILDDGPDGRTLVVGESDWPLPVPIVRRGQTWFFDCVAGKEEITNRRIGRNELSAIQVCGAIADAQHEYAIRDPDGDGVHAYAQKFLSDPGRCDGLYWPIADSEQPSPLGELVATAAAEGYARNKQGPTPYHGYCYRILQAQGPSAPGGSLDYVVKGKMILGFAVVAYPVQYNKSGIMTFIMGVDGVVYQKDMGDQTTKLALAMKLFEPGEGWTKVE